MWQTSVTENIVEPWPILASINLNYTFEKGISTITVNA